MMQRLVTFFGFIIFKHGKPGNPQKIKFILIDQVEFPGQMVSEISQASLTTLGWSATKNTRSPGSI
jgi:hypothetical protein